MTCKIHGSHGCPLCFVDQGGTAQRGLFHVEQTESVPAFDGRTYERKMDHKRLASQLGRTWKLMGDGRWRTLAQISLIVGCSEAGASARLRDLRKVKFRRVFPNHEVQSRRIKHGLWVYRVIMPEGITVE